MIRLGEKTNPTTCRSQDVYSKYKDTERLKVKKYNHTEPELVCGKFFQSSKMENYKWKIQFSMPS